MVAMNYQNYDKGMSYQYAKFRDNGGCGYILKPSWIRDKNNDPDMLKLISQHSGSDAGTGDSSSITLNVIIYGYCSPEILVRHAGNTPVENEKQSFSPKRGSSRTSDPGGENSSADTNISNSEKIRLDRYSICIKRAIWYQSTWESIGVFLPRAREQKSIIVLALLQMQLVTTMTQ